MNGGQLSIESYNNHIQLATLQPPPSKPIPATICSKRSFTESNSNALSHQRNSKRQPLPSPQRIQTRIFEGLENRQATIASAAQALVDIGDVERRSSQASLFSIPSFSSVHSLRSFSGFSTLSLPLASGLSSRASSGMSLADFNVASPCNIASLDRCDTNTSLGSNISLGSMSLDIAEDAPTPMARLGLTAKRSFSKVASDNTFSKARESGTITSHPNTNLQVNAAYLASAQHLQAPLQGNGQQQRKGQSQEKSKQQNSIDSAHEKNTSRKIPSAKNDSLMSFMFDPNFQSLPEQAKKIVLERFKNRQIQQKMVQKEGSQQSHIPQNKAQPVSIQQACTNITIGATAELPYGWTRHIDQARGRLYYYHHLSRRSTWTHPAEIMKQLTHASMATAATTNYASNRLAHAH